MKRNFDEFSAEVFRRRDEKLVKIKRQRKILLSLSLPLTLSLLILLTLPSRLQKNAADCIVGSTGLEDGAMADEIQSSSLSVRIEIKKDQKNYTPKTVENGFQIYSFFESLCKNPDHPDEKKESDSGKYPEISMIVTDEQGERTEYNLYKNDSYITKNGRKYSISKEETEKLEKLLSETIS